MSVGGAGYAITGIGDLHGDGHGDLFKDASSGSLTQLQMNDGPRGTVVDRQAHTSSEPPLHRANNRTGGHRPASPRRVLMDQQLRLPIRPKHRCREPEYQGSRKLSLIIRVTGFRMYSITERRPTFMSATTRIPGLSAKSSGKLRNFGSVSST